MSRTYRRRNRTDEYRWVLREWTFGPVAGFRLIDRHTAEGRRAIARFHSDSTITMSSAAPHWYRRVFNKKLRTFDEREVRRWITNLDYEPLTRGRHRHDANWSYW